MTIVPCDRNKKLSQQIIEFAETLKTEAHKLGSHGLDENDVYNSGLFRGAIERIRGQFAATMSEKREFVRRVLSYMQDRDFIASFESSGERNRHDYTVALPSGKLAVIELKGCLDGNNTNIFERPAHAQEFIIWSVCSNPGADPQRNVWSGIHTRLSAEIIANSKRVDGLIVWDWVCGTIGRPCPKLAGDESRRTTVAQFQLPPACIYAFPPTIPSPRNNPKPRAQDINAVELLRAFQNCFLGYDSEVNYVDFEVAHQGNETVRKTIVRRNGIIVQQSDETAIRRE
jgi:hypothetical protein